MKEWTPEGGTPQGGIISPLLANIYLDGLDKTMENRGFKMIRYADDFVVLCKSKSVAEDALRIITRWMSKMELTLNTEKTKMVNMNKISDELGLPDYVVLGNNITIQDAWNRHPMRSQYHMVYNLGYRSSYTWLKNLRSTSKARIAGWVYERNRVDYEY